MNTVHNLTILLKAYFTGHLKLIDGVVVRFIRIQLNMDKNQRLAMSC